MATQFVLQPCKLRNSDFVPTKDEVVTFSWKEMLNRFAVSGTRQAVLNVRGIKLGSFIGMAVDPRTGKPTNFYLWNPDFSGSLVGKIKKDPGFTDRILEVYRVEHVEWDAQVKEFTSNG